MFIKGNSLHGSFSDKFVMQKAKNTQAKYDCSKESRITSFTDCKKHYKPFVIFELFKKILIATHCNAIKMRWNNVKKKKTALNLFKNILERINLTILNISIKKYFASDLNSVFLSVNCYCWNNRSMRSTQSII